MKKLLFVVLSFAMFAGIGNAVILKTSVVSDFNLYPSSLTSAGILITTNTALAHLQTITITYENVTSSGSILLYDNLKGGASTAPNTKGRIIYGVRLSTGCLSGAQPMPIQEKYDIGACPVAVNGLQAVHEGGTGKKPIVAITYW